MTLQSQPDRTQCLQMFTKRITCVSCVVWSVVHMSPTEHCGVAGARSATPPSRGARPPRAAPIGAIVEGSRRVSLGPWLPTLLAGGCRPVVDGMYHHLTKDGGSRIRENNLDPTRTHTCFRAVHRTGQWANGLRSQPLSPSGRWGE